MLQQNASSAVYGDGTNIVAAMSDFTNGGPVPTGAALWYDSGMTVYNATEVLGPPWIFATGTINSITTYTGGTTPSFTVGFFINGTAITGCSAIVVTTATPTTTTCTGANTIARGQTLTAVISAVSGTPQSALIAYTGTSSIE